MSKTILVVDNDPPQRRPITAVLEREGFAVTLLLSGDALLDHLAKGGACDVILLDLVLPGRSGIETLVDLRARGHQHPVIVLTASGGIDTVVSAMQAGACDFFVKPASPERIAISINNALSIGALRSEVAQLRKRAEGRTTFDDLVGNSPAMQLVRRMGERAARSSIPILISGESGVGKEVIARAVHGSSDRAGRPFVAINCGAIPATLVESILFGHEKGSFTGATERHAGKFQEANGGTLLLVSHSTYHIQKLCKHALWLREGRVQAYGDVFDVTQDYLAYHERKSAAERGPELDAGYAGSEYRLVRVAINDREDEGARLLAEGESLRVEAELHSPDGRSPQFGFGVIRADGTALYGQVAEIEGVRGEPLGGSRTRYALEIDPSALLPGSYVLRLHAMDPEGLRVFDTVERAFTLRGASRELGCVRLPHRWLHAGAKP